MGARDQQLADDIIAGGKRADLALQELIREVRSRFILHVVSNNGREEDAKDAFQDGLIILILQLKDGKFKGSGSLTGYLRKISWRQWLQKKHEKSIGGPSRKGKKDDFQADHGPPMRMELNRGDPFDVIPELDLLDREKYNWVRTCFSRFGEKCVRVLELYIREISREDIARQLGISVKSAGERKSRCLKNLKNELKRNVEFRAYIKKIRWMTWKY